MVLPSSIVGLLPLTPFHDTPWGRVHKNHFHPEDRQGVAIPSATPSAPIPTVHCMAISDEEMADLVRKHLPEQYEAARQDGRVG